MGSCSYLNLQFLNGTAENTVRHILSSIIQFWCYAYFKKIIIVISMLGYFFDLLFFVKLACSCFCMSNQQQISLILLTALCPLPLPTPTHSPHSIYHQLIKGSPKVEIIWETIMCYMGDTKFGLILTVWWRFCLSSYLGIHSVLFALIKKVCSMQVCRVFCAGFCSWNDTHRVRELATNVLHIVA